ncbi:MAG: hypothetical protein PHU97_12110 [Bacteroidales bacterium]|nr:hypothetical protein [Bacteroidales bacterium]MDD3012050.1 hypothetical protein [Bacteroidales bacterium]MDD3962267.1 hypothetical protein [Bacteroidales bacterium]MDY0286681.1 hypothetical protein [Bacteroidales bacterium]HPE86546.1 hypothetical protein [Bacteroidales bacterium]
MKKLSLVLAAALLMTILLSSCKTRERCPAYGESHKFQVEQGY